MRKVALAIVAAAVVAPSQAEARDHVPGCNTDACDKRIGKRWAKKHRAKRSSMASAVASWYGPGLYGNTTACGQTLTPGTAGVAHKTLPCGTRLRLCFERCTTTRVIDRGPYVGGRTFDLTAPVKAAIGMGSLGTVRYSIG